MSDNFIKKFLKNNIYTKGIYAAAKERYHRRRKEKGIKIFNDRGTSILFHTQEIICKSGLNLDFFFAFGTLLGIIRDGELLGRDMDLDMVVFVQDNEDVFRFRSYLEKNDYIRLHSFEVDGVGITQDAFIYDDIMIDINYARKYEDVYYNYIFFNLQTEKNKILIFPFSTGKTKQIKFKNYGINVPSEPEKYLKETYGEKWQIPDPNYIFWENKQAIKTDLKGKVKIINKFKYC